MGLYAVFVSLLKYYTKDVIKIKRKKKNNSVKSAWLMSFNMISTQSLNRVMPTGLKDADWKTLCKVRFERGNPYRNFPGVAEYIRSQPVKVTWPTGVWRTQGSFVCGIPLCIRTWRLCFHKFLYYSSEEKNSNAVKVGRSTSEREVLALILEPTYKNP